MWTRHFYPKHWWRGRHNGMNIAGVRLHFEVDLLWWSFSLQARTWCLFGQVMVHCGPFHLWIYPKYEERERD